MKCFKYTLETDDPGYLALEVSLQSDYNYNSYGLSVCLQAFTSPSLVVSGTSKSVSCSGLEDSKRKISVVTFVIFRPIGKVQFPGSQA